MQAIALRALLSLCAATLGAAACGGIVVFERDETGGGGGSSSNISSVSSSTNSAVVSSSTGNACDSLLSALEIANDHARACSPLDPGIQCNASEVLLDPCGCPSLVANETLGTEVAEARAAYEAWVAAGCGPYDCAVCQRAKGGFCLAEGDGSKGRCEAVGLD